MSTETEILHTCAKTSLKRRLGSTRVAPFTSLHYTRDAAMSAMADEVHRKCNTMDAKDFLEEFFPNVVANIPDINVAAFQKVAEKTTEIDMYRPLIGALAPFCTSLQLLDTHATPDPQSSVFNPDLLKPDISAYKAKDPIDPVTRFSLMETHIEIKLAAADDAFSDEGEFESDSVLSHDTRGQLVSYANAQMASQYRTHLFTVFICADKARLLRWDRSGVTVTHAFRYDTSESTYLQEFFWRFGHADDATRGWDTSVTDPTPEEASQARHRLGKDESELLFKFAVYDARNSDAKPSFFIAGEPFDSHAYPTGRATRCFIAYHVAEDRVVFMKDTWRIVAPDLVAEGRIYERLHEAEIPHIAEFVMAGDIPGRNHKTFFQPREGPPQKQHQHYRLVLGTIGRPLTSFRSSWEMVNAIKDAMIAHQHAYEKLQIMHQDVSVGNILITEDTDGKLGGILIDWDLCQSLEKLNDKYRTIERTGTWEFISAKVLLDPTAPRTVTDDLESFLHVFTWVTIMFTPTGMSPQALAATLRNCYNDIWGTPDNPMGGMAKEESLAAGRMRARMFRVLNPKLHQILEALYATFGAWYGSDLYVITLEEDPSAAQQMLDRLRDHKWMLDTITNALSDPDTWPADDGSQANPLPKRREMPNRKRKADSELDDGRALQKVRLIIEDNADA